MDHELPAPVVPVSRAKGQSHGLPGRGFRRWSGAQGLRDRVRDGVQERLHVQLGLEHPHTRLSPSLEAYFGDLYFVAIGFLLALVPAVFVSLSRGNSILLIRDRWVVLCAAMSAGAIRFGYCSVGMMASGRCVRGEMRTCIRSGMPIGICSHALSSNRDRVDSGTWIRSPARRPTS